MTQSPVVLTVECAVLAHLVGELLTGRLIKAAAPRPERPNFVGWLHWEDLLGRTSGGLWIGRLERIVFFIAFMHGKESVAAGWLAFKLASKWEVWRNVIQVPTKIAAVSDLDWFVARNNLGSWLLVRFWVGTLTNIVIAAGAAAAARALA